MGLNAKYVHTNLVAVDWRRLAQFYVDLFDCQVVLPERNLVGEWLDSVTGIRNARIQGAHLRLPGHGEDGPTLEIFEYTPDADRSAEGPNYPGFGHIAFSVDNVASARSAVLAAGGDAVGEMVTVEVAGAGEITFIYMADPEGNIIELQSWRR